MWRKRLLGISFVILLFFQHSWEIWSSQAFQKELGKRASSVQALKRSTRDLEDGSDAGDQSWVHAQMAELSSQWESVCKLSLQKQGRLDAALKQAGLFFFFILSAKRMAESLPHCFG